MSNKGNKKTELLLEIYRRLFATYGQCVCPLNHQNPYELLVAVVLSAQCRDDRVNLITPEFFRNYPTPEALAKADFDEVKEILRPIGLYRAKAVNLISAAKRIVEVYSGEVPHTMEDLVSLTGVGRKTANVILGDAFGTPGFPVDTHVKRLLKLIGISSSDNPETLERLVNQVIPEEYWTNLSHLLIRHGRNICQARCPSCSNCKIADLCKSAGHFNGKKQRGKK